MKHKIVSDDEQNRDNLGDIPYDDRLTIPQTPIHEK